MAESNGRENTEREPHERPSGERQRTERGENWAVWIALLFGIWVVLTPLFFGNVTSRAIPAGAPTSGVSAVAVSEVDPLFWSNIIAGIIIVILTAYAGTRMGEDAYG